MHKPRSTVNPSSPLPDPTRLALLVQSSPHQQSGADGVGDLGGCRPSKGKKSCGASEPHWDTERCAEKAGQRALAGKHPQKCLYHFLGKRTSRRKWITKPCLNLLRRRSGDICEDCETKLKIRIIYRIINHVKKNEKTGGKCVPHDSDYSPRASGFSTFELFSSCQVFHKEKQNLKKCLQNI